MGGGDEDSGVDGVGEGDDPYVRPSDFYYDPHFPISCYPRPTCDLSVDELLDFVKYLCLQLTLRGRFLNMKEWPSRWAREGTPIDKIPPRPRLPRIEDMCNSASSGPPRRRLPAFISQLMIYQFWEDMMPLLWVQRARRQNQAAEGVPRKRVRLIFAGAIKKKIHLLTCFRRDDRDSEVTQMGRGESYRPNTRPRSPPRPDLFRDRSPRRERARTPPVDSYHPGRDRSPRRRSRSRTPPRRERSPLRDNWRARPRSPPRARSPMRARSPPRNRSPPRARSPIRARSPPRRFSPRRDDRRARSPPRRDERRRSRSPFERDRPIQRPRSPFRRSPPAGPRGGFRQRSRSIERRDDRIPTGPSSANWRRRSPTPPSGRTSGNTSRRSSPPIHPERLHLTQPTARDTRPRSPLVRERSPSTQLAYRDKDSARSTPRERSPVRPVAPRSPPRGPAGFRAPTGPSGNRNFTAPVQSTMSNHNSSNHSTPVVPPAGPRGYVPPVARGGYRGGRGSFGSDRNTRPDSSSWGAAPPQRGPPDTAPRITAPVTHARPIQTPSPVSATTPSAPAIPTGPAAIPTGPRAGVPSRPPVLQHSSSVYGRNPSISAANNGPRSHPALSNMPQIIPGGRIDPTATGMTPDVTLHMKKLEEEEDPLRAKLYAKEETLRQSLKQWDKLSRESAAMSLRSELSERHVRQLAGEGVGGAAF